MFGPGLKHVFAPGVKGSVRPRKWHPTRTLFRILMLQDFMNCNVLRRMRQAPWGRRLKAANWKAATITDIASQGQGTEQNIPSTLADFMGGRSRSLTSQKCFQVPAVCLLPTQRTYCIQHEPWPARSNPARGTQAKRMRLEEMNWVDTSSTSDSPSSGASSLASPVNSDASISPCTSGGPSDNCEPHGAR